MVTMATGFFRQIVILIALDVTVNLVYYMTYYITSITPVAMQNTSKQQISTL